MRIALIVAACVLVSPAALAGKDPLLKYEFHVSGYDGYSRSLVFDMGGPPYHGHEVDTGLPFEAFKQGGQVCAVIQQAYHGDGPGHSAHANASMEMICFSPKTSKGYAFRAECFSQTEANWNTEAWCSPGHGEVRISRTKRQP